MNRISIRSRTHKLGNSGQGAVILAVVMAMAMSGAVGMLNVMAVQKAKSIDKTGYTGTDAASAAVERLGQDLAQRFIYPAAYVPMTSCDPTVAAGGHGNANGNSNGTGNGNGTGGGSGGSLAPGDCLYLSAAGGMLSTNSSWNWDETNQKYEFSQCDASQLNDANLADVFKTYGAFPDPATPTCALLPTSEVALRSLYINQGLNGNFWYYEGLFEAKVAVPRFAGDPTPEITRSVARLPIQPPPVPTVSGLSTASPTMVMNTGPNSIRFSANISGIASGAQINGPGGYAKSITGCDRMESTCTVTFNVTIPPNYTPGQYSYQVQAYQSWPGGQWSQWSNSVVVVVNSLAVSGTAPKANCQTYVSNPEGSWAMRPTEKATLNWSINGADPSQTYNVIIKVNGTQLPAPYGTAVGTSGTVPIGLSPQVTPATALYTDPDPTNPYANAATQNNYTVTFADGTGYASSCTATTYVRKPQSCSRTFCNYGGVGSVFGHIFVPDIYAGPCNDPTDPVCSNPGSAQLYYGFTVNMPSTVYANDGLRYQVWSQGQTIYAPGDDCIIHNYASPLILDLDGTGIKVSANSSEAVPFDIRGEGKRHPVAWPTGSHNAFLVYDRNRNGQVDGGRELFGNATLRPDGRNYENGFDALSAFDSNRDGIIDARDPIYSRLELWTDRNRNGRVDSGELQTLARAGVKSLQVSYRVTNEKDAAGNLFNLQGQAFMADGTKHKMIDVILNDFLEKGPIDAFETAYSRADFPRAYDIIRTAAARSRSK